MTSQPGAGGDAVDKVNPTHYAAQGEYSALHVVQKWGLGFCLGNALKYISRAGKKPGEDEITDLKKAVWYIQRHMHERDPSEPDPCKNRPAVRSALTHRDEKEGG